MPKNQIERSAEQFREWVLAEILKFRARFIHVCYKAILPKELYDVAKEGKDMKRVQQWAKDNGWQFMQKGESLLLLKDGNVIGEFRPVFEGGQLDPHLIFYAMLAGERLELVQPHETNPNGFQDLITAKN